LCDAAEALYGLLSKPLRRLISEAVADAIDCRLGHTCGCPDTDTRPGLHWASLGDPTYELRVPPGWLVEAKLGRPR
jgi:hypothetical protein